MQNLFLTKERIEQLLEQYGSPVYVYSEAILRQKCADMRGLLGAENSHVSFSVKANTNLSILKIARDAGMYADAMSAGEIFLCKQAGFAPQEIFYVCNNVSADEMRYAVDQGLVVSIDSVNQMRVLASACPGARAAVRVNTEFGDGHSDKVVTAGKKTKFGVQLKFMQEVAEIAKAGNVKIVGLNQHIGSSVQNAKNYEAAANVLIDMALEFPELEILDFGGGFFVPYRPEEEDIDLDDLRAMFVRLHDRIVAEHPNGANISMRTEPGRYVVADCGILLGTVEDVKENFGKTYVGTDIGFNVLARPMLYDAYHHIVLPGHEGEQEQTVTVTGNICESGDILAKDRNLPIPNVGDPIVIQTAGAYGYVMSSVYNCRMRPAEVLIDLEGRDRLIRRRETIEDLLAPMLV
ncbi:MAG: diaminopimelate decarboxylase [Clostridia bacterium]|nr:diaminopimelate decarboxylase [Clostridia bacterium]